MEFKSYDCAAKAEPGEPTFTLLARDPLAASLVRAWAISARDSGAQPAEKTDEAFACADQMEAWRFANRPYEAPNLTDEQLLKAGPVVGGEGGESWFIDGHHPDQVAIELVKRLERLLAPENFDEIERDIDEASVARTWLLECESNEERAHSVSVGTRNAKPYTVVQL